MASLGCRIGRVLPRINRVTRGSLIAIPRYNFYIKPHEYLNRNFTEKQR